MGLRARLALFFVAITVVPVTVAVIALQLQIDQHLRVRSQAELRSFRGAATALISSFHDRAGDYATELVSRGAYSELAAAPADAQAFLESRVGDTLEDPPGERPVDFVILVGSNGRVLASESTAPEFEPGWRPPSMAETARAAVQGAVPPGVILSSIEIVAFSENDDVSQQRSLGWVVAGLWTDGVLLERIPLVGGAAIASGGEVLAALNADPEDVPIGNLPGGADVAEVEVGEKAMLVTAAPLLGDDDAPTSAALVVWAPLSTDRSALGLAILLLVPSVLVAAALGWFIAGGVVAPVSRAAEVARSIAGGDLSQSLEPTGGREVRELAVALNTMSAELGARMREIERSRDELRGSLARLGQTLSSSLDLNRTLSVVVETAMATLGADRAVLMLLTPEKDALYTKVGRGLEAVPGRLEVGQGLAGFVAKTGVSLRLPAEHGVPAPGPHEPSGAHQLLVPMHGRGRVIGVLSLIRDEAKHPFTDDDLNTIRSFAAQISVAIENVMLHQEAQRLSVTDPLTGLWNFRYFQLQAERELESTARYERNLSLVIVDIDFFKDVNDRHGHQTGDEVLVEIARRLREATRAPDVVARYGGEEFVVLLPGTDYGGGVATAERIRVAVGDEPITVSNPNAAPIEVTCSAGVATFPRHGRKVGELLRSADAAMYLAKTRGRDRVAGADEQREPEPVPGGESPHTAGSPRPQGSAGG